MVKTKNEVYKCQICGNIVEVSHVGGGELVCCGQPMQLMTENTEDASHEKHVPIIEIIDGRVIVRVGTIDHPMEENHYIEWIELITTDEKRQQKFLKPGDQPRAEFHTDAEVSCARAYCNVHGLWKNT